MDVFRRQSPLLAAQNHQRFLPILDLDGLAGSKVGSQCRISHQLALCYRLHADKYVRCLPVFQALSITAIAFFHFSSVQSATAAVKKSGMKVLGIIPARYASTRFPGKPLALIAGKPLIRHVVERCQQAKSLAEVIVATDDTRIWEVAQSFCRAEMTAPDHPSGSDRIAEVAARCACDAVVNVQGDEPLIDPAVIDAVADALAHTEMSTAATPVNSERTSIPRATG